MFTESTLQNHHLVINLKIWNIILKDLFSDYDTLYCMRESLGNEEDEAKNATQESITTTTTTDDEEIETPLKEAEGEGYGLKALIKYKIKKVKNTWSNIKSLLNYGYER